MAKYQSKYLRQEPERPKKKFPRWLLVVIPLVILLAVGACLYFLIGNAPNDNASANDPAQEAYTTIETPYCDLRLQADAAKKIRHVQTGEGKISVEVFYMLPEDGEKELFRIYFAAEEQGERIGLLQIDNEDVPVSFEAPQYTREDFESEQTYNTYCTLMDQLNVVLDSIRKSEDFRKDDGTQQGTPPPTSQKIIGDWQVELPENVQWKESTTADGYHVDFYTEIDGKQIQLYTIIVGEPTDTVVGSYNVDGTAKSLSIRSYTLQSQVDWTDEERTMTYAYAMETVNTVLQAIMASENFLG